MWVIKWQFFKFLYLSIFRNLRFVIILIGVCVLSSAQSRQSRTLNNKTIEASQAKHKNSESGSKNRLESDYYSEIDEEYETKIEDLRSVKNWILTGLAAVGFIGSLVIIIVLIHLKSRQISGLKSLLWWRKFIFKQVGMILTQLSKSGVVNKFHNKSLKIVAPSVSKT